MSIQLYDYQEKAKEAVLSHFEAHAEALIVMACGLGKTYLAAAILAELLIRLIDEISKSDKPERKPRTLVLCHNNEILEQSRISFHEVLGDSVTTGLFHGGEKDFEEVDILFASIQTMNVWKEAFLVDEFDVVIMDECHHVMASTYLPTVTYFKPKYHMGLTATPDRMDGLEIRDVFGQEVVNIPLSLALARSYLTLVEYHIKNGNLCKGELKKLVKDEFEEGKAISKRISTKQLNETIFIERRDEEIARIILEEDLQAIIFCERIEHAENFSQFIPGSETVHCEKTPRQNSDIIDRFRRKELQYILVVDKLNEGVDIPSAELIVFLRCTDSIPLFIQQLGRGLRKAKGKDKIKVFDFVSNADRLQFVSVFAREVKASCHDDLEQDVLQLSGDGFEFSFSEELQDMLQILESIVPVYISDVPELLAEYDPERNELPADQVFACTGKKLWWKCGKCGHEWQATGANRVYGTGCPACASKVVTATNNLTVTHPHLATEYMDGNELPVGQVIAGTNKKLWWKCSKCGHEWQAKGNTRSSGAGCPACAGQVATATNNLTVTHPHLATEYMDKNKLPVDQVIAGTN
ncbi:DEAD/DEAH box helicase family protein, partial [Patescibacteria group bacterium]|nr:DEAD/DEAH box helicase family protein [Patescibacteria group bacterium]